MMIANLEATVSALTDPFFELHQKKLVQNQNFGILAAHYTSAENALNIINSEELWLRSAAVMNDTSEISFGVNFISNALRESLAGKRLHDLILSKVPGGLPLLLSLPFLGRQNYQTITYLSCLSEHQGADTTGKLSMWRAYGGPQAGAALLFDTKMLSFTGASMLVSTRPVFYEKTASLEARIDELANVISNRKSDLDQLTLEQVANGVLAGIRSIILTSKDVAFEEEREWRIIYEPLLHQGGGLPVSIENIQGIPQEVYKLPLKGASEGAEYGLKHLLKKVLIGPSLYPEIVKRAFVKTLQDLGFDRPEEMVVDSGIPLRR